MKLITYGRLSEEFENFLSQEHPAIEVLRPTSADTLRTSLINADVYAGFDYLEGCDLSSLSWIHSFAAGVDSLMKLNIPDKIKLSRTTGRLGQRIGEFCLAYILIDSRNAIKTFQNQQRKHWEQLPKKELTNQKILILGTGSIGSGITKVLGKHFEEIHGLSHSGQDRPLFQRTFRWEELKTRETDYDIVINALPDTPDTHGILDRQFFDHFSGIHFMNVGRGNTVNERELIDVIDSNRIRLATLDVFEEEPLPHSSPLWDHPKVLVTPHQSGVTTIDDLIASFEEALQAIDSNRKSPLFVDMRKGY